MPLLDHFNPPLNRTHPRRSFHGAWAAAMARLLNQGILPPGYYAVPLLDRDGPIEIDVAALQTWTPPAPGLAVAVELTPDRRRRGPGVRRRRRPAPCGGRRIGQPAQQGSSPGSTGVRRQVRQLLATRQQRRRRGHRHHTTRRPERRYPFPSGSRCRRGRDAVEPVGDILPGRRTRRGNATTPALAVAARTGPAFADSPLMDRFGRFRASRLGSQLPGDLRGPAHPPSGVIRCANSLW